MLLSVLFDITVVVTILTLLALVSIVGVSRLRTARPYVLDQLRTIFPYLLLVGVVLLINNYLRTVGPELSWIIGIRITELIIGIEGAFVSGLQTYAHPSLTAYFSLVYVYGYIFLLVFPVLAYLVHRSSRPVKETLLAYTLNYGLGVFCYILFIAYGPRNVTGPAAAEGLLYTFWPSSQLLTSEVNAPVNVFPSLHTSLAVTVALLAYRWRDIYPRWLPISVFLAVSVAISTMYLGIHWATDVVAGTILAGVSVWFGTWLTRPARKRGFLDVVGRRLRRPIDRLFDAFIGRFS